MQPSSSGLNLPSVPNRKPKLEPIHHQFQLAQPDPTLLRHPSQLQLPQKLHTQQPSESQIQPDITKRKVPKGYELAQFYKAQQYFSAQAYRRKTKRPDQSDYYQTYEACVDTKYLRQYGLGVYLHLQFIKRLTVTLLIMSAFSIIPILYAYQKGSALQKDYTHSYMIIMAMTSLGNIFNGDRQAYLIFTVSDLLSMVTMFFFYLHWRSFHKQTVQEEQKDNSIVNPTSYVLSVNGNFKANDSALQKNLLDYINKNFLGAYEVQVVHNYGGNFSKFVDYQELIEKRQKQRQVIVQTNKTEEDYNQIQKQIQKLQQQLSNLSQAFQPEYAIIHFRTLKARNKFINFSRRYSLVDNFSYSLKRFLCCVDLPPRDQLFMGKEPLMIKSINLSRPEQINWNYLDITGISRGIRWFFSIFFLIVSIAITSSLIALCTLYVSSTAACNNFDPTTLLSTAKSQGGQTLYCYCSTHFTQIYSDPNIKLACGDLSNTILFANLMQIGASLISAISNVVLIYAVALIAKYLLKPDSKPKEFTFIFSGVLLSNYINASILPLVMNGDIFGFQSLKYLTFIDFIDFNKVAVFKDYDTDWYAVVAPYYMNFLIIAIFSPIISLVVYSLSFCYNSWSVRKSCQNQDKQKPVIQKEANSWMASILYDLPTQQALVCLYFFMTIMYSSLLPILIPITCLTMMMTFICKKTILLKFVVRIPADQALSEKVITLMPFVMLLHFLMGIWAHTADGVFSSDAFMFKYEEKFFNNELDRVFNDLLMLGGAVVILAWLIFDYTILAFFQWISQCCFKDQLQVPVQFASIENAPFGDRMKKANVLGSYKLINHPTFGHAIKAFKELKRKIKKDNMRKTMRQTQNFIKTKTSLNPSFVEDSQNPEI